MWQKIPQIDRSRKVTVTVAARMSPLSQAQVDEVKDEIWEHFPNLTFHPVLLETLGDRDLKSSLRTMEKTDFFTKEIDTAVLEGTADIGIHSAKDLPEPIHKDLHLAALTKGMDAVDVVITRDDEPFESLKSKAIVATSSIRREEAVRQLRPDLTFVDLRGTIHHRLSLLEKGDVDAIVMAEAALIRLKLNPRNRFRLPGETAPNQGKLAVICRCDHIEMMTLFRTIDSRIFKKIS